MPFPYTEIISFVTWAVPVVFSLAFTFALNSLKETESRDRLVKLLADVVSFRAKYFQYLQQVLDFVAAKISGGAWSSSSYDWVLRVAYCYPVAVYIGVWVATGRVTAGFAAGLPDGASLDKRLIVLGCLLASIYLYDKGSQASRRDWMLLSLAAVGLLAVAAFLAAGQGAFIVIAAVGVASVVSIINGIRGVTRHRTPYSTGKIFVGGALAGLVLAGATALLPATATYSTGLLMLALAATIGAVFSLGGEFAKQRGQIGVFLVIQWLAFILTGLLVARYVDPTSFDSAFVSLYVMWGVLPFLTAPFDWMSLALTVTLVSGMIQTAGRSILRNTILDYLMAVIILYALAFVMLVVLGTYHAVSVKSGHAPFIDPTTIIATIKSNPWNPQVFWIYAMVATTLLPKLIHTTAAALSLWTPFADIGAPFAARLTSGDLSNDFHRRFVASLYFGSLLTVITFVSALFFLAGLLFIGLTAPLIGSGVLAMGDALVPQLSAVAGLLPF